MPASVVCSACPVCVLAKEEADFYAHSSSEEDQWEFCETCNLQAQRVVTQGEPFQKPLWGTAWKNRVSALVSSSKRTDSALASALASAPASAPASPPEASLTMYLGNKGIFGGAPNPKDTTYRLSEFLSDDEEQCMQSGHTNIQTMQWNQTPPHKLQVCLPNFENDIKFMMTQYVALATMNKLITIATRQDPNHTNLSQAVEEAYNQDLISVGQYHCLRSINHAGSMAKHYPVRTSSQPPVSSAVRRRHSPLPPRPLQPRPL